MWFLVLSVAAFAEPDLRTARPVTMTANGKDHAKAMQYARSTFRDWAEQKLGAYPAGFWESVGHGAQTEKAAKVSVAKLDAEVAGRTAAKEGGMPTPPPHSDPSNPYSKAQQGPCRDTDNWQDVMGHGCNVYEAASSKDERMCYGGEPRMPTAFYMMFADEDHGNAIDACCACGKGNPQYTEQTKAWNYPVHEPGPDECRDLHGWLDSQGSDCAAYAYQCLDGEVTVPMEFIAQYKDQYGLSATDACCKCGRAAPTGADACFDDDWTGPEGEKCYWLSDKCRDNAPLYPEEAYKANADDITALSACCMCGGGLKKSECRDKPGWKDKDGYNCGGYTESCMQGVPLHNAHHYEEFATADGTDAMDACCVCGGGEGRLQTCRTYTEWVDNKGQNCDGYGTLCEGEHKKETVADEYFLGQAHAGMSALDACCNCGGGHEKAESCKDTAGWTDKEGFDCKAYPTEACIGGRPLHDDLQYTHVANEMGVSALDACCHCGGGHGGPMCAHMNAWVDSEGMACDHYEGKAGQDAQCENGYPMRPHDEYREKAVNDVSALEACCGCGGGVGGERCHTNHMWKDSEGFGCDDYDTSWCKAGEPLHHFYEFSNLAVEAGARLGWVSALDACCQCGGGVGEERCANHEDWTDKNGKGCDSYRATCEHGFPTHGVQNYIQEANADGVSALDACCICGGGAGGPRCDDHLHDGSEWTDDDGYGCHDYETACNGRATEADEEYTKYATKTGISAKDACCRCGGGTITRSGKPSGGLDGAITTVTEAAR